MHPLRPKILRLVSEEALSPTGMAAALGASRQLVNYHARALERAGFLRRAGRQRKRNMVEQLYTATARAYVIAPEALSRLSAGWKAPDDAVGAAALQALVARAQVEVAQVAADARKEARRLSTLSVAADVRFESAEQRAAFGAALQRAVADIVAKHSSPAETADGRPGKGRPYRVLAGCYPTPRNPGAQP